MKPAQRAAAKKLGLPKYFTGKLCKRGHVSERLTVNGGCIECGRIALRLHRETELGRETSRRSAREWYAKFKNDPEVRSRARARAKQWLKQSERTPERKAAANARMKKYYSSERGKDKKREYQRRRKMADPCFKLRCALRLRLYHALRNSAKKGSAINLLGCSVEQARAHIEALWKPGMCWENHGHRGWHIDHKRALSRFDLADPLQLATACHFTNLQPLWGSENCRKGAR